MFAGVRLSGLVPWLAAHWGARGLRHARLHALLSVSVAVVHIGGHLNTYTGTVTTPHSTCLYGYTRLPVTDIHLQIGIFSVFTCIFR